MVSCVKISIYHIIRWCNDSKENEVLEEKLSETIIVENIENHSDTEYKIDFEKLKETNNQVVGWLKVKGTQVEYPVVQTKYNSYYMNRNLR